MAFCARAGRYAPRPAYRRFFGPAYGVGTAAVLLGMLCLLLDLGRADRALSLFLQPVPSFISVGAYALVALVVLSALLAAVWTFGVEGFRVAFVRVVRVLVVAVAGVVVAYTGLFLASMPAVPLWASPWLPPLFVASALSCGCALLACTCVLTGSGEEFASTLRRVQKADVAAIACELAVLAAFGIAALGGSETARLSMERLVAGDLAPAFWAPSWRLALWRPVRARRSASGCLPALPFSRAPSFWSAGSFCAGALRRRACPPTWLRPPWWLLGYNEGVRMKGPSGAPARVCLRRCGAGWDGGGLLGSSPAALEGAGPRQAAVGGTGRRRVAESVTARGGVGWNGTVAKEQGGTAWYCSK